MSKWNCILSAWNNEINKRNEFSENLLYTGYISPNFIFHYYVALFYRFKTTISQIIPLKSYHTGLQHSFSSPSFLSKVHPVSIIMTPSSSFVKSCRSHIFCSMGLKRLKITQKGKHCSLQALLSGLEVGIPAVLHGPVPDLKTSVLAKDREWLSLEQEGTGTMACPSTAFHKAPWVCSMESRVLHPRVPGLAGMLPWVCSCETIEHSYPVTLPSSLQRTLSYVSVYDRGCRWPSRLDSRHFYEGETLHTSQTAGLENLRGLPSGPWGCGQRVGKRAGEEWQSYPVRQNASSEASKSHTASSLVTFSSGREAALVKVARGSEKLVLQKGLLCSDTLITRPKKFKKKKTKHGSTCL